MERWVGKTAVVTGASAGIGAAICVRLADAGMRVVGLARRPQLVEELKSQVRGSGIIVARRCDVSSPTEVEAAFAWVDEKFDGTDVLVNNAGVFCPGTITDVAPTQTSEEDLMKTIDINVKGVVLCARRGVASMRRRRVDGHVVNISSIAGHYIPFASIFNVYPGTKHAVSAVSASLDNELQDYGSRIKVSSVSPGLVKTEMVTGAGGAGGAAGPAAARALLPSDVADAVHYVLSTPPGVNINELTITPVGVKRL